MAKKYPDALRNWFYFLENSDYPSLGPNLYQLGFFGIWHPKTAKNLRLKLFLYYSTLAFFFSSYIKFILNVNINGFMLLTQYAPLHINIIKTLLFFRDHKHWEKLVNFTGRIEKEQFAKKDSAIGYVLNHSIAQNRRVTYFHWGLCFAICTVIICAPYVARPKDEYGNPIVEHIIDGYTPFGEEPPGCYYSVFIDTFFSDVMAFYLVGWNSFVRSLMIFFAGQLKIAQLYGQRLIEVGNKEKSHNNIVEFHTFYMSLIEYQKLFNSLISLSMFLYVVVTAINFSTNVIHLVQFSDASVNNLLNSSMGMLGVFMELFLMYWYSSKVTDESLLVSDATFTSDWVGADLQLQREVSLMAITTSQEIMFSAGPFHKMTLEAFVTILQASYSFFTLINNTSVH